MKSVTLGGLKSGIQRLREKGGASKDALYDLVNAFVDASGSPRARPGTTLTNTLPAGTKGLAAFGGKLQVFAARDMAGIPDGVQLNVLRHPDGGFTGDLSEIHFAKPFLGNLYVVAEFDDGQVWHYWLRNVDQWQANHVYLPDDVVSPTVNKGFIFTPSPADKYPEWKPKVTRAVGDVIVPTEPNGYKYTCVEVSGDSPASGQYEPDWKAADGAKTYENVGDDTPPPPDDSGNDNGGDDDGGYGGTIGGCVAVESDMEIGMPAYRIGRGMVAPIVDDQHRAGVEYLRNEPVIRHRQCVRLHVGWRTLTISADTDILHPEGQRKARDMAGYAIWTSRGWRNVRKVTDAGLRPVIILNFGGTSFGAGDSSRFQRLLNRLWPLWIYSHNAKKIGGTLQ